MQSTTPSFSKDVVWMDRALRLAKRGYGATSPNPMVGAVLVKGGKLLGQGWHRQAGEPHAEVEAIRDAQAKGANLAGSTLYVTLEPCSTFGRTPPCTEAIVASQITRVVAGATDPNPKHAGHGFELLKKAGIEVAHGVRAEEASRLNETFHHWVVHRTPFVTVKAALTLDGKIATASGESRWITGPNARALGMQLRQGADAILVGINTVLTDDPMLTVRKGGVETGKPLRRIVLDARGRTPLHAQILSDAHPELTTIVVSERASARRMAGLSARATVLVAPASDGKIDVRWLLAELGQQSVTSLLVEGGGEVNAAFLLGGFAQRIAFFYAPKIMGGRGAPGAVGGAGAPSLLELIQVRQIEWRRAGQDFLLTGRVDEPQASGKA